MKGIRLSQAMLIHYLPLIDTGTFELEITSFVLHDAPRDGFSG